MKLIIASQNSHKISEIRAKLPEFLIEGLDPAVFPEELLETGTTLKANALQKARQVYEKTGNNCFADDTGLEVEALNGDPGVYSARYAGNQKSSEDNMDLLLSNLKNNNNRKAHFKTVIALIYNGEEYFFEGVCEGVIAEARHGDQGFGYDPIFKADGATTTFADMEMSEKAIYSHRGKAIDALSKFLKSLPTS